MGVLKSFLKAVSVDAKTSHALMKASRHGVRDNEPIGTLSFHLPGNQIGFALRLHDRRRPFDEVEPAALEQLLPGIMNGCERRGMQLGDLGRHVCLHQLLHSHYTCSV